MYCKFQFIHSRNQNRIVLIVAKCIVNEEIEKIRTAVPKVLIVAKCIVNLFMVLGSDF